MKSWKTNGVFLDYYLMKYKNEKPLVLLDNKDSFTSDTFIALLSALHIGEWCKRYSLKPEYIVYDGILWELEFKYYNGHKSLRFAGDNAYPNNFRCCLALMILRRTSEMYSSR